MRSLSGQPNFFGLDLGVTAVRLVELRGAGPIKNLGPYGFTPFEGSISFSDSKEDQRSVGIIVGQLIKQLGITTKNVVVNLPSNRVFSTVIDMDRLPPGELDKTIKYQADAYIPTPLAKSKMDWAVIGDSPKDPNKVEVLISSVANEYVENRLNMIEAIGLNVVAFEPDTMALARSLVAPDSNLPELVLDIGNSVTDLVISIGSAPHLSRSIPIGQQTIVQAAAVNLGVDAEQARQFVYKFGLSRDKLEGKVYNSILAVIDGLVSEIEKSIKFFAGRYAGSKLDRIIVTGNASILPELPLYIANKFAINVEIGNAWRNVSVPAAAQNEALAVSSHFAVAVGLAERTT